METMEAAMPKERAANWPIVQQGDKGANVYAVQCLLNYHGASLNVDGSFDADAYNAAANFQQADGKFGSNSAKLTGIFRVKAVNFSAFAVASSVLENSPCKAAAFSFSSFCSAS